jgi:biopolymer transport protein ExbD
MINSQKSPEKTLGAPEITPLIDIVFIVIVFLLITANSPLLTLPIAVPAADQESDLGSSTQAELVITITADQPYWHIGSQSFKDWGLFKEELLLNTDSHHLTIAADKAAPTEPLLKLLSLLNQQKIANAKIVMQQESEY